MPRSAPAHLGFIRPEIDDSGIPWALLAREQNGGLEFAGPAILRPQSNARAEWAKKFAAMAAEKPALKSLRRGKAQWWKPEIRVRARYLWNDATPFEH
jgi:hypothetical protein